MSCDCEPFRFESEMFNPLMSVIPTVFNVESGQRTRVVCRPAIGPVIPDLLLGIWTGDLPRRGGSTLSHVTSSRGCRFRKSRPIRNNFVDQTMQNELQWIDAGLEAWSDLKVTLPVFATIALSEGVLQVPPLKSAAGLSRA
jgi:hypothetical protein